jgi:hypothetical protein
MTQQQTGLFLEFLGEAVQKAKAQRQLRPAEINWIYGAQSPLFPGMVKIGRSKDPEARLSSGNTFTMPNPFVIIAKTQTLDSIRDEKATHIHFSEFRDKGEFFKISEKDLKSYFDDILTPLFNKEIEEDCVRLAKARAENEHGSAHEVNNNHMDGHPVEVIQTQEFQYNKKRKRDLNDLEISERRLALERGQVELEVFKVKSHVDVIIQCMTTIDTMCGGLEDADKLWYRALLNMVAKTQFKYIVA